MTGYSYILIIHLSAFALFTGALVTDIIIHKQLWSFWQTDAAVTKALFATTSRYTRLMGISLGIALVAGIALMSQMHQVYGPQSWIRIKIALVVLLLILRVLNGRNSKRLKDTIFNQSIIPFTSIKNRATVFQMIQLVVIAVIIILSVTKVN
jgi:uncharacterized membrane protein